jgi:hypothetical protein
MFNVICSIRKLVYQRKKIKYTMQYELWDVYFSVVYLLCGSSVLIKIFAEKKVGVKQRIQTTV